MSQAAAKKVRSPSKPLPSPAAEPQPAVRRRQRLSPEARAEQILDVAARLLLEDGFTEISMERLGREAGISKALVYNYFPSRNELLKALLQRENRRNRDVSVAAGKAAGGDFVQLLLSTTKTGVEVHQQRGALLNKLWAEPAVAREVAGEELKIRDQNIELFTRKVVKLYGLPQDLARAAVITQMAVSGAASQHFADGRKSADEVTRICVTMILGSLDALARAQGKEPPPYLDELLSS